MAAAFSFDAADIDAVLKDATTVTLTFTVREEGGAAALAVVIQSDDIAENINNELQSVDNPTLQAIEVTALSEPVVTINEPEDEDEEGDDGEANDG